MAAGHDKLCEDADVGSLCDCSCAGAKHAIKHTKGGVPGAGAVSKAAQKAAQAAGKAPVINNRAQPKDGSKIAPAAPKTFKDAQKSDTGKDRVIQDAATGKPISRADAAERMFGTKAAAEKIAKAAAKGKGGGGVVKEPKRGPDVSGGTGGKGGPDAGTPGISPDRLTRGQKVVGPDGGVHEVVHTSPVFPNKTRVYHKTGQFEVDNNTTLKPADGISAGGKGGPDAGTPGISPDRLTRGQKVVGPDGGVHEVVHTSPVFPNKTRVYHKTGQFEVDNNTTLKPADGISAGGKGGPDAARRDEMSVLSRRRNGDTVAEQAAKPAGKAGGASTGESVRSVDNTSAGKTEAAAYVPPHVQDAIDHLEGRKKSGVLTHVYGALSHDSIEGLSPEQRGKLTTALTDLQRRVRPDAPDRQRVEVPLAHARAINATPGREKKAANLPERQAAALDQLARTSSSDRNAGKAVDLRDRLQGGHSQAVIDSLAKKGLIGQGGTQAGKATLTEEGHKQVAAARGDLRHQTLNRHIEVLTKTADEMRAKADNPGEPQYVRDDADAQAKGAQTAANALKDQRRRHMRDRGNVRR